MILLTRHAKSAHNRDNIFAGIKINSELVDEGRENTSKLATKIFSKYNFDVIICSTLLRTYQTAQIYQKLHEKKYRKSILIVKTPLLNEVNVGVISGLSPTQVKLEYPMEYNNIQSKFFKDWTFTQGDTPELLFQRYLALREFISNFHQKNILLVGHAMFNKVILYNWLDLTDINFGHDLFIELSEISRKK